MTTRLCLICHPATPDMRAGRFPVDPPLDERGYEQAIQAGARIKQRVPNAIGLCSPAACARQTAEAFDLRATPTPSLCDVDYGTWRGKSLAAILQEASGDAHAWLHDPFMRSHGGEAFADVILRVGTWLDALLLQGNVIAITHAAVIRAALVHVMGAPPAALFQLEAAPLSVIELRRSTQGWRLWLSAVEGTSL